METVVFNGLVSVSLTYMTYFAINTIWTTVNHLFDRYFFDLEVDE